MSFSPTFRRKLRKILFKGLEEEEYVIYNNITTLKRERERERAILRAPVRTRGR